MWYCMSILLGLNLYLLKLVCLRIQVITKLRSNPSELEIFCAAIIPNCVWLSGNVRYIYAITSSEVIIRTSKNSGHDVFLVQTPYIRNLNQVVWDQMTA